MASLDTVSIAILLGSILVGAEIPGAERVYGIIVVADACADPDAEAHDLLVTKIFPKQGRVISVSELSDLFA